MIIYDDEDFDINYEDDTDEFVYGDMMPDPEEIAGWYADKEEYEWVTL